MPDGAEETRDLCDLWRVVNRAADADTTSNLVYNLRDCDTHELVGDSEWDGLGGSVVKFCLEAGARRARGAEDVWLVCAWQAGIKKRVAWISGRLRPKQWMHRMLRPFSRTICRVSLGLTRAYASIGLE